MLTTDKPYSRIGSMLLDFGQRFLRRTLKKRVHLSTGFVVFLSIASTSLLICVYILQSRESQIGNRVSSIHHDRRANGPMLNRTSLDSQSDHFYTTKRQNRTKPTKNSDSSTGFQFTRLLPSQAGKQKERATSSPNLQPKFSEENHSIHSNRMTLPEWLFLQSNRTSLVQKTCAEFSSTKNSNLHRDCRLNLDGILIDKTNRILYCAIPKVASSSLKLAMAFMTGRVNRNVTDTSYPVHSKSWLRSVGIFSLDYLFDNDSRWLKKVWSSLRTFIVVRHPIERLISAYVDKFTLDNKFSDYFQHRYGRKIVRLYRNVSESRPRRNTNVGRRPREADDWGHDVSFKEFVRFLIDQKIPCAHKSNPHWMSYFELCHPCFIDYSYVIHYENLTDEMWHLWESLYSEANVDEVLKRRNAGKTKSRDLASHYVNQLPYSYRRALFATYELDFRLFRYSF